MDQKDIDLLKAEATLLGVRFTIHKNVVNFHGYVPMVLGNAPSIKRITLIEVKNISVLDDPNVAKQFRHVEQISFEYYMPKAIGMFAGLKILKLSFIDQKTLPKSIGQLENLTSLILNQCNIQQLPDTIRNLTNLRNLEISFCENLKVIPATIGLLQKLTRLEFYNTPKISLPKSIGQLINLNYLNVCLGNYAIPETIGNLKNLEIMVITICGSNKKFPDVFDDLINLEAVYIFDSKIILPPSFYKLHSRNVFQGGVLHV